MLPSNLSLSTGKTKGYNNKILVGNTDMKIGSNRVTNKNHKKLPVTPPDVPKTVIPVVRHDPVETTKLHNLKMLTEKHNDEKLAITLLIFRGWVYCLQFVVKNKLHHYYLQSVVPW